MTAYHDDGEVAEGVGKALFGFVEKMLAELDKQVDKRLVRTLLALLLAMLRHRHRENGLLLSELGCYLVGDAHAPAGTKRISNLLRSKKWDQKVIEKDLWARADVKVAAEKKEGRKALVLWDGSVVEKPETVASADLCAVRSSKAARKLRIKPGYPQPPTFRPIFVPGLEVVGVLVAGMGGAPVLANLSFWTRRGKHATTRGEVEQKLFAACSARWKDDVLHLCDRGYASAAWVGTFLETKANFVVRWRTDYHLVDAKGKRSSGQMCKGKRSQDFAMVRDARHHSERKMGILYFPVTHPQHPETPLWLVVARPKDGNAWHFLTNLPITSLEDAWHIVFVYARRWQIEMVFRFLKSELALESPRLWFWENRLKLLAIVALLYAFLVSLLLPDFASLRTHLLDHWCKRTGKRLRDVTQPLSRLRFAISRLLLCHPIVLLWRNSG